MKVVPCNEENNENHSNENSKSGYFCNICPYETVHPCNFDEHCNGKRHKEAVASSSTPDTTNNQISTYRIMKTFICMFKFIFNLYLFLILLFYIR